MVNYSYRQLRESVQGMASAMRANGVTLGDRVAGELLSTGGFII